MAEGGKPQNSCLSQAEENEGPARGGGGGGVPDNPFFRLSQKRCGEVQYASASELGVASGVEFSQMFCGQVLFRKLLSFI